MDQDTEYYPDASGVMDIDDVLRQLEEIEASAETQEVREEIQRTKSMMKMIPGRDIIDKYTSRDIAEGFIGGIIFSLPLLVEGGVFEIARWFTITYASIPMFLVLNVTAIILLTLGLLYGADIREVKVTNPIFGFIPRRLVGVLFISLLVSFSSMYLWGRLHEEDPTTLEAIGRITVVWAAAAMGATLGDILPGESKGEDINELIDI